ncbi:MAG TPA: hypothetical protein VEL28_10945 [Candidatus Binatia bacterium]|nr:hypothetical protein [Candidatus Binatia bacterium]
MADRQRLLPAASAIACAALALSPIPSQLAYAADVPASATAPAAASAGGEAAGSGAEASDARAGANAADSKGGGKTGANAADAKAGSDAAEAPIEIRNVATSWDNLSELFSGGSMASPFAEGSVFVVRGELINRSGRPVHHVLLRYELLDGAGAVVHDLEGYNRLAEAMRPDESGKVDEAAVRAIPPRGSDTFRMVFFSEEIPRFASHRVRVVEVHDGAK